MLAAGDLIVARDEMLREYGGGSRRAVEHVKTWKNTGTTVSNMCRAPFWRLSVLNMPRLVLLVLCVFCFNTGKAARRDKMDAGALEFSLTPVLPHPQGPGWRRCAIGHIL